MAASGRLGHPQPLFAGVKMLALAHTRTFTYVDGPVEFEARDETGRPYLAGLVEYRDDGDLFIIVPTSEDELAAIAAGSADARQLFLINAATAWHLSEPYPGAGAFEAHRQSSPISEHANAGDPGFSLTDAGERITGSSRAAAST